MANVFTELQHPDFIWTWKESVRGTRQSIWLPYLQAISKKPRSKLWQLSYNGGEIDADLSKVDFIMLYGGCGNLPAEFLDDLNQHRICLAIHRRNMPRPYWFLPASGADADDLLSAQIIARENLNTAAYVARAILREKLHFSEYLIPVPATEFKKLSTSRSVDEARAIEAHHAARYWEAYATHIGLQSSKRRNVQSPVHSALDACSFFLHGVLLRWTLFHKFSPYHGFLHRPTGYPSLIYDLIEPYRHWIEKCVIEAIRQCGLDDQDKLVASAIAILKGMLDEPVYVPATRQTVRRKSLLHGAVLALRAWLLGKQARLVIPVEGKKKGGRPPQVGFAIPGYQNK